MKTIIAGIVAVAVIAVGGWYFWQQSQTSAPPSAPATTSTTTAPSSSVATSDDRVKMKITAGDKTLGDLSAPVTIVEYASMSCPHCADFHSGTFKELKKNYIDTGKVYFVFRDFPFDQRAFQAAVLAHCSGY